MAAPLQPAGAQSAGGSVKGGEGEARVALSEISQRSVPENGDKTQAPAPAGSTEQQPRQGDGTQQPDSAGQLAPNAKELQLVGSQQGAGKVDEDQGVVASKGGGEEALGTEIAPVVGEAKLVPSQGNPGEGGNPGKDGHSGQKAQGAGGDQVQAAWSGLQISAAAGGAQPGDKPVDLGSALHESILSQVKDGAVSHTSDGSSQISIRLNPGELGELKIQVHMDDNRLKVDIQADNPAVKDLLMSDLDSLKQTLSNKNFNMEGFNVSTGGGGFNAPLPDDKRSSQQAMPRPAKAVGYPDQDEGRVNYLTEEVNALLDVRF
jgi:flagellar hook-length control protein FliK